jgi:hypothetical protein
MKEKNKKKGLKEININYLYDKNDLRDHKDY